MDELGIELSIGTFSAEQVPDIRDYCTGTSERLDVFGTTDLTISDGSDNPFDNPELIAGPFKEGLGWVDGFFGGQAGKVGKRAGKSEPKLCSLDTMTQWGKVPE